jgi:ribonuclease E
LEPTEEEIQAAMAELAAEQGEVQPVVADVTAVAEEAAPVAAEPVAEEPVAEPVSEEPEEEEEAPVTTETPAATTPTEVKTFASLPTSGAPETEPVATATEIVATPTVTDTTVTSTEAEAAQTPEVIEEDITEEVESAAPSTISSESPNKELLKKLDELINRVMTLENLIIKQQAEARGDTELESLDVYGDYYEDEDVL